MYGFEDLNLRLIECLLKYLIKVMGMSKPISELLI